MIDAPYTYFKQLIKDAQLGANVRLLVESEVAEGQSFTIFNHSSGKILAKGEDLDRAMSEAAEELKRLNRKKSDPFFRPASLGGSRSSE